MAPPGSTGVTNLFVNPTVVKTVGVSGVLKGVAPSPALADSVQQLTAAMEAEQIANADWQEASTALQTLQTGFHTPAEYRTVQRALADAWLSLHPTDRDAVLAASGWQSAQTSLSGDLDAARNSLREKLGLVDVYAGGALGQLHELVEVQGVSPGVSYNPQTETSATWIAQAMRHLRFDDVEILRLEEANPMVIGLKRSPYSDAKTVVVYAHHDVMPVGDPAEWRSGDPFQAQILGDRLYGRGTADDKGGVIAALESVAYYERTGEPLPVNVLVISEGEEESGSDHLPQYLRMMQEMLPGLNPDVLIIADSSNTAPGVPTLSSSLRGAYQVRLDIQTVGQGSHAGANSFAPSAIIAGAQMLTALTGPNGELVIPGLTDQMPPLSPEIVQHIQILEQGGYATLDRLRAAAHMSPDLRFQTPGEPTLQTILGDTWRGLTLQPLRFTAGGEAGQVAAASSVVLQFRIPPGVDPAWVKEGVDRHVVLLAPPGVTAQVTPLWGPVGGWALDIDHPAVPFVEGAFSFGFDHPVVYSGEGGSVPFINVFQGVFPDAAVVPIGIEDPLTNAHAANESLFVPDFVSLTRSLVSLYEFLGGRVALPTR